MSRLRLVSVVHPSIGRAADDVRLGMLANTDVTFLATHEQSDVERPGAIWQISIPARGRGQSARFPSLGAALHLLEPDVVHLQADPDSQLALQVAQHCRRHPKRALVLEIDLGASHLQRLSRSILSTIRARRTLSLTHSLIVRNAGALAAARRVGFKGVGSVAGRGLQRVSLPERVDARRRLGLSSNDLVLGWAGPLGEKTGILDLLEAVAICNGVTLVIPAAGSAHEEVMDRADALEILDRVHFVAPEHGPQTRRAPGEVADFPTVLAASDALVLARPTSALEQAVSLHNLETAQIQGLPIIYTGVETTEAIGRSGWAVPIDDPAIVARLFASLCARPDLLRTAAQSSSAHADQRHSPEAAAAELERAIHAAHQSRRPLPVAGQSANPGVHRSTVERILGAAFRRQPSGT